jgi:hypothetical protein
VTPHEIRRKHPLWRADKLGAWKRRLRKTRVEMARALGKYNDLVSFADKCRLEIERLETGG